MQTASMCPHRCSECAKADLIIIHFLWFNKVPNWHFMGYCRRRACDIRAGTQCTSCDPGSTPSSPLAQTTQRDNNRTKWDTFLFFQVYWSRPRKGQAGEGCGDVFPSSQDSSREITQTTGIWSAMCSLQMLFQMCPLIPYIKCLGTCVIAPLPPCTHIAP